MAFKKVLVFDDNLLNQATLRDALAEAGYDAETVENLEGYEKAIQWWRPDAVVMEINLPRADAARLIADLRARGSAIPVVLMSAAATTTLGPLVEQVGADGAASTLDGMRAVVDTLDILKQTRPDLGGA